VRLFLDALVSARRVATALRERHNVRAADEQRELDGWDDERLLELATEEGRIMVTFNVADSARVAKDWAAASRSHAGCLLIVGIDHAEFGLILRVIEHALSEARRGLRAPVSPQIDGRQASHGARIMSDATQVIRN
jgi:hypothetical protein